MNNVIEIFEKLLERFKFKQPVPSDVQEFILSYKEKLLVFTLKNYGEYNLLYGFVLKVYFNIRKFGIRLSVFQSKLAAGFIIFFLFSSITTGILLYFNYFDLNFTGIIEKPGKIEDLYKKENRKIIDKNKKIDSADENKKNIINDRGKGKGITYDEINNPGKYRLGIESFKSNIVSSSDSKKITDIITGELVRLKGKNKIVRITKRKEKKVNFLLLGSVEKIGSTFIMTAKIVDVENSKVVFTVSDNADTESEIKSACSRMARKVAGEIK